MAKKRDTYNYSLMDGNKKVYVGSTNDPKRREAEHKRDGKKFTSMKIESGLKTKESALRDETLARRGYETSKGKSPKYNKQ